MPPGPPCQSMTSPSGFRRAADTSTLIYKDFGVLLSGVGQRVVLTAPITVLSVTTQIRSSFAVGGYIYLDLVKDDGSGKPSNVPSDIIATSIDKFWTFESDRTCTF